MRMVRQSLLAVSAALVLAACAAATTDIVPVSAGVRTEVSRETGEIVSYQVLRRDTGRYYDAVQVGANRYVLTDRGQQAYLRDQIRRTRR